MRSGCDRIGAYPLSVVFGVAALLALLTLSSCGGEGKAPEQEFSNPAKADSRSPIDDLGIPPGQDSGECPIDEGTVSDAFGVGSATRDTSLDGLVMLPIRGIRPAPFFGPPVVHRQICAFDSDVAAVAVQSSPPEPAVKRDEIDPAKNAPPGSPAADLPVQEELLTPAANIEEIREDWESIINDWEPGGIAIDERPEWGDEAFLAQIDGIGSIDTYYFATTSRITLSVATKTSDSGSSEPLMSGSPESAIDALVKAVGG